MPEFQPMQIADTLNTYNFLMLIQHIYSEYNHKFDCLWSTVKI